MSPSARPDTKSLALPRRARPRPRRATAPGIVQASPEPESRTPDRQAKAAGNAGQNLGFTRLKTEPTAEIFQTSVGSGAFLLWVGGSSSPDMASGENKERWGR